MNNPDNILVCDRVEYGMDSFNKRPQTWRVTHHLKRVEDKLDSRMKNVETADDMVDNIITKILLEDREEERQKRIKLGLPATRRYKLLYCKPEEATHLSLVGIDGAHAPIDKCKKIGTVEWTEEHIVRERANAISDFWLKNGFCIDWDWE